MVVFNPATPADSAKVSSMLASLNRQVTMDQIV
jgi:hypothetical protein